MNDEILIALRVYPNAVVYAPAVYIWDQWARRREIRRRRRARKERRGW